MGEKRLFGLVDYEDSSEEDDASDVKRPAHPDIKLDDFIPFNVTADEQRVRRFPAVRGNWPSLIFIELNQQDELKDVAGRLAACMMSLADGEFRITPNAEPHISISRTFVLRLHQIEPLADLLRPHFTAVPSFQLEFGELCILVNEDCSRAFLCLKCTALGSQLHACVEAVNEALQRFSLPAFYASRELHVSLASWALSRSGDGRDVVGVDKEMVQDEEDEQDIVHAAMRGTHGATHTQTRATLEERFRIHLLNAALKAYCTTHGINFRQAVTRITFRAGNKVFRLPLLDPQSV